MYQFQQMIHRAARVPRCAAPLLAGGSPVAQSMRQLIALATESMDAVLLKGPAGSGKLALARSIHSASPQRDGSFIEASGAAFDLDYLTARWNGTLYLRNIMLLPVPVQHKLLVWLDSEQALFVRLIAASDADDDKDRIIAPLRARLERLYIPCPPLSQRRADIMAIAQAIWDADRDHLPPLLNQAAWTRVANYDWAENYRSLSAFADEAARRYGGKAVSAVHVEQLLEGNQAPTPVRSIFDLKQHLAQEERRYLVEALLQCNGVVAAAAAQSGLKRTTFLAKMKRYGLARI